MVLDLGFSCRCLKREWGWKLSLDVEVRCRNFRACVPFLSRNRGKYSSELTWSSFFYAQNANTGSRSTWEFAKSWLLYHCDLLADTKIPLHPLCHANNIRHKTRNCSRPRKERISIAPHTQLHSATYDNASTLENNRSENYILCHLGMQRSPSFHFSGAFTISLLTSTIPSYELIQCLILCLSEHCVLGKSTLFKLPCDVFVILQVFCKKASRLRQSCSSIPAYNCAFRWVWTRSTDFIGQSPPAQWVLGRCI